MSKVYSFRLNKDNPREAKAEEVINTWAREGYSLRCVIVDALLYYKKNELEDDELNSIVEQLKDMISSLGKETGANSSEGPLSTSFLHAVKQTVRSGVSI